MANTISKWLLGAAIAASSFLAPAPAHSRSNCYFETSRQAYGAGRTFSCRFSVRRNSSGDSVLDVTWHDGVRSSYIFWGALSPRSAGTAEIFSGGRRHLGRYIVPDEGNLVLIFHDSGAVTGFPLSN